MHILHYNKNNTNTHRHVNPVCFSLSQSTLLVGRMQDLALRLAIRTGLLAISSFVKWFLDLRLLLPTFVGSTFFLFFSVL